jgi:hypothetical protein
MDFEKHHQRMLLRHDKAIAEIDEQLKATAKLVRAGMRIIIDDRKEFNFKLNALTESQMKTEESQRRTDEILRKSDEKFNRLMDKLLRKNGHGA